MDWVDVEIELSATGRDDMAEWVRDAVLALVTQAQRDSERAMRLETVIATTVESLYRNAIVMRCFEDMREAIGLPRKSCACNHCAGHGETPNKR